ncbi:MAG: tRNA (adenosine(37)-N6)-threonylcarbamoyltransferase complex dimerization subunit type 1 TsaB [Deinococcales bacterium]
MLFLAIDTATHYLSLALVDETKRLGHFCQSVERDHAKRLLPELDKLLEDLKLSPLDIKAIGVGLGPGSYTGLRVGVASAKALAKGLRARLYGYSSLEAMVANQLAPQKQATAVLDAHRGQVYVVSYALEQKLLVTRDLAKVSREALESYPVPQFEGLAPEAFYLAERAREDYLAGREEGRGLEPLYL